jgi:acyl carrier protein
MDPLFAAILRPFLKYAGTRDLAPESSLRDLGLDSMQAIELLFALEDTYQVAIPDDLLTNATFETAGSLWAAVLGQQATAAEAS